MIIHVALSVDAAYSGTGIRTLVADARLIKWTFGVEDTFGSAFSIWITVIFWKASAGAIVTLSVRTAW